MSTAEQTPKYTDEQLFWGAYQAMGRDVASQLPEMEVPRGSLPGIGHLLDVRLDEIRTTRFPMFEDVTEGWQPLSEDEKLTFNALLIAQHELDATYSDRTGYHRNGCSFGGPVRA